MAESENNKPKTEKTSASVTSTLPRLCPKNKIDLKDTSRNIPKLKNRFRGSRSISDDNKKCPGLTNKSETNLQKSKLTESKKSNQVGFSSNSSLVQLSPRNYHGLIPVFHRHSLNYLRMSPPVTRSPSPVKKVSPKEKPSSKIKTITLDYDTKKKTKTSPRSPSPARKSSSKKTKSSASPSGGKNSEKLAPRRGETKQTSPRINSPAKRKSKSKTQSSSNVDFSPQGKPGKVPQIPVGDSASVVLKQSSQPSLCVNEKLVQPQEKISLDHLKNEVYGGDHRRLSFQKVHLCIEKSTEKLNLSESKRRFFVTYSSENIQQQEEISMALLQNLSAEGGKKPAVDSKTAVRTLSGQELILTPSMKIDLDGEDNGDSIEISELLHEAGDNFDEQQQKEVHIPQDDANEYDSEVSTDGEDSPLKRKLSSATRTSTSQCSGLHWQSTNSLWKSREADLLNDVDYRQSVYHPAVSRRQKGDGVDVELKTRSVEDNFDYEEKTKERAVRSRSASLQNKYMGDKLDENVDDRSWGSDFGKTDGRQMYNSVLQDVPFYGMKRMRTKKERVSGALLHFTLKMIRLLAIFNLWPGDNCYMLTSQSLR